MKTLTCAIFSLPAVTCAHASRDDATNSQKRCVLDPVDMTNNLAAKDDHHWEALAAGARELEQHIIGNPSAYRTLNGGPTGIACLDVEELPGAAATGNAAGSRNEAQDLHELCQKNRLDLEESFHHSDAHRIPPQ